MTTAAMVLGVVPLITATGAGAVSRFQMGLVIATGPRRSARLFTLFVVPAVYLLLAADHHSAPVPAAAAPATASSWAWSSPFSAAAR